MMAASRAPDSLSRSSDDQGLLGLKLDSFTYVGDIVQGLLAALQDIDRCRGEIFNLGIETSLTTAEAIGIVERLIGRQARIERRPPRPGDQLSTQGNVGKARAALGYNPSTSPDVGLAETVRWYRDEFFSGDGGL